MPSLSALLGVGAATLFSVASATKYTVQDTYAGSSFFDHFNFGTEEKTNGFVKYVDRATAKDKGYISYEGGDAIFGVDYKSKLNSGDGGDIGRESVRLEGKTEYNKGLFVLDIKHMPGGICGTWPSFWSLGREPWPVKGEIDIIEGVNKNSVNSFVLHTNTNCKTEGKGQSGVQALKDCAIDGPYGTTGCGVTDTSSSSYGAGFNANNGGYYVTEWQAEGIKIWFFPRGSEPKSLTSSSPDTAEFGTPNANFQGDCDIEKRFMDQRFIFTNTFCGDWGGNVYAQSGCPMYDGLSGMASCKKYVAEHPEVFKDAYWRVSSFKTYNKRTITSSSSVAPSSTPHASYSSSVHVSSSSAHVSSSSAHVSSSSVHVSSSSVHIPSSSVHIPSSSVHIPSSSVHIPSSSVHVSSSSAHVSSSSVAHSSSVQPSSVVHSSATPTPHVSSSIYPSSNSAASSSYPHDVSSSVVHDYSSTISASALETPYSHDSSSVYPSASSSNPVSSDISSVYPSGTPYGSSSIVYPSETPYDSSAVYPSGTLSSAYPDTTSYPVGGKSSSSTPVYSTSAPVYSVYPEGDGYEYGSVSSKTPDASSKASEYPAVSSEYPGASSKVPGYDTYPTASTKAPEYGNYPVASSSAPVYGNDYPSNPVSSPVPGHNNYPVSTPNVNSTPVYADYPELPSFTPLYSTYPISSKPSYDDDKKSTDSYKTTTAYETTYVDVCPTGYTTITTKVTAIQTPAPYPTTNAYYAPPGFEVTTKYCAQGCGEGPKTVTVTVPCSKCQASTPVPNKPTGNTPYTPVQSSKPSTPEGSAIKITATKIVTLTKVPVPESQYYATHPSVASPSASLVKYPNADSGKSYGSGKPVAPTGYVGGEKPYPTGWAPASKPVQPTGGNPVYSAVVEHPVSNITISYGTATSAKVKPTQTGYKVPEFTGAASGLQVGGVVAGVAAVFAAMMM